MDPSQIRELHFITPLVNLRSILQLGILSHVKAKRVPHESVALEEIQERRADVRIPNGLRLHEYANLYFNARNCMMYRRQDQHSVLGVISVKPSVLDIAGVIVSDRNSSTTAVKFGSCHEMLPSLSHDRLFARSWNHSDPWEKRDHKQAMCAEVLVPESLPTDYIRGVYVSGPKTLEVCEDANFNTRFKVNKYLFFRGEPE